MSKIVCYLIFLDEDSKASVLVTANYFKAKNFHGMEFSQFCG